MTFDAILEVSNAFLQVLSSDPVRLVFMAPVAGVATVVVRRVTRRALSVVVSIQHEELGMIESGRLPLLMAMALTAASSDLSMQTVAGRLMATLARV
jgi:hypothetical protein